MIGLDTNILLRLIIEDDSLQTERARSAVRDAAASERILFINLVVLVECVWVLESVFRKRRSDIAAFLETIIDNRALTVEREENVRQIIPFYRDQGFDFADLLIGLVNRDYGCAMTYTFDRKAAQLPEFQLLT